MNCGTILLSVLLGIVVLVTLAVLAIMQYGWVGAGMVAVGLIVVWFVGRRLIRLLLLMPFIAKGSVLKNAIANVRGVRYLGMQRAEEYEEEEEEDEEGEEEEVMADEEAEAGEEASTDEAAIVERQGAGGGASELATMFHVYEIDVEITPRVAATKQFRHWDVDDLMVVPHGTRPSFSDDPTDAELGTIRSVKLWNGADWVEDEIGKHEGSQRLLLELAADEPLDRGQFQYYFYTFGDIRFPPAGVGSRAQ